ncbi:RluA family pseudouridine synthase [Litoreibacter janthinus]|uniref:Pseudouridine synthase n=1 Tax=Litoreibacter janthinus TaxID=670154 RepID=A0A1I6G2X2_9RHOB|nr:RluA family pseudouridine synthase [Litoreibacter janthinus]SFR36544.1 ribosomal large subunit pseudouridine synthase A [Litoreibacter janthinus]
MSSSDYNPPTDPLDVIHEDAELLLVNKPAGLLSVPGKGEHLEDCLISRVQVAFPSALLVHRLDRDTSGVMVFALTKSAQRHLGLQFERRHTKKVYVALVHGAVDGKSGEIHLPMVVDWPNRPLQHVNFVHGKQAITQWRRGAVTDGVTRMRLSPLTGRSHQLRVHMQALGHPILGDPFYSDNADQYPRMMLHAESLKLRHPEGGKAIEFKAKAPF